MSRRTIAMLVLLIVLLVGAAVGVGLLSTKAASPSCQAATSHGYHITIQHNQPSTTQVRGELCDTLTFTNEDAVTREIAFGPHEHHVPYDGVAEKFLNKGQSFTVTFDQVGSFHWHDHLHDEIQGDFTVDK